MSNYSVVIPKTDAAIENARRHGARIVDNPRFNTVPPNATAYWISINELVSPDTVVAVFGTLAALRLFMGDVAHIARSAKSIVKNTIETGAVVFPKKKTAKKVTPKKTVAKKAAPAKSIAKKAIPKKAAARKTPRARSTTRKGGPTPARKS